MNMKRRFGVLTLGLAAFLAVTLHGTTAANFKQGLEKTLRKHTHRYPVTEMVALKIKGAHAPFDQKVAADDDWLRGLTVSVKNTSPKPIMYVGLDLTLFDKKHDEVSGKLPFVFPMSYGTYTGNLPGQSPAAPSYAQVIQPGDTVDITLTDEQYESLLATLSAAGYPVTVKDAELTVVDVIFADDTRWYKSMLLRRDPEKPGEWLRVWRGGTGPIGDRRAPTNAPFPLRGVGAAFFLASYSPGGLWSFAVTALTLLKPAGIVLQTETCKEARPAEAVPCGPDTPFCIAMSDQLHEEEGTEAPATLENTTRACWRPEINGGGACNRSIIVSKLVFCDPPPTPTPTPRPEDGGGCSVDCKELWGQQATCYEGVCSLMSPVLVDVAGDGFALTDAAGGVDLALTATGGRVRLSWTAPNSDDAWLALDRDGNGSIGGAYELFGNFTPQPPASERHGFLALAEFDKPERGGNADGRIDARDAVFPSLRLWQDADHDGVSQPSELHPLQALDVARIHLNYKESKKTDAYGNLFRYRAKVDDARGAKAGRWAWDVFLVPGR